MKLVGTHGPLHGRCLAGAALLDRAPSLKLAVVRDTLLSYETKFSDCARTSSICL